MLIGWFVDNLGGDGDEGQNRWAKKGKRRGRSVLPLQDGDCVTEKGRLRRIHPGSKDLDGEKFTVHFCNGIC